LLDPKPARPPRFPYTTLFRSKDLHRGLPTSAGWDDIIVRARARRPAIPGRAALRLAARPDAAKAEAPAATAPAVQYRRVDRCPEIGRAHARTPVTFRSRMPSS